MKNKIQFVIVLLLLSCQSLFVYSQSETFFTSESLVLKTDSGNIHGTLLMPTNTKGKIPVALIISGSGPTDRDGNNQVMKNNALKLLAESLAKNGIASLRYDKRAIGESKAAAKSEIGLSFEDYINDAKGWLALLKQNTHFSKLVVIGHSEGSLIGMNAAILANGFVSVAGAGSSADLILKEQISVQGKAIQELCFPLLDSLKAGKLLKDVNPALYNLFRPSIQPYMISWFKHDPQSDIKKLTFPCLIVQGDNDLQIKINDAKLLAAASKKSALVIIEKMNHVLKIVDSGDRAVNIAAYSDPNMPIAPALTDAIVEYIKH
jgi:pimeloyl-ACP methyl ester carboxylesterase